MDTLWDLAAVRHSQNTRKKTMFKFPFEELTLDQIKRIMDLCQEIHEDYWMRHPDGFCKVDACINPEICPADHKLDQLYRSLSTRALRELIALKEFGKRVSVCAQDWKSDLRFAERHCDYPYARLGNALGLLLDQGIRNLVRTKLLPGMPVWET